MKKPEHPLDDFFREALKDHSMVPSEAARKAFLQEVVSITARGKNNRKGLIILALFAFLSVIGIFMWFIFNPGSETRIPVEEKPQNRGAVSSLPLNQPEMEIPAKEESMSNAGYGSDIDRNVVKPETSDGSSEKIAEVSVTTEYQSATVVLNEHQAEQGSGMNIQSQSPDATLEIAKPAPEPIVSLNERGVNNVDEPIANTQAVQPPTAQITEPLTTQKTTEAIQDTLSPAVNKKNKGDNAIDPFSKRGMIYSFGVHYTPELMYNTLEGEKLVQNFGVEGIFRFGPFSIRTGAGFLVATGTNEVSIEYHEYLGTFNKLDSMDFTWDNVMYKYLPTYYLSRKDVYDSLLSLDNHRIEKRYSYLRIPMILGYDFIRSEKWSVGFRVGPMMSVLLGTRQLSGSYDEGKNMVVHINDITPEQVSLNWQAMVGFNTGFRFSERFRIELEPSASYYFNSVFEKPGTSVKPWSTSIRAAFLIQF